VRRLPIGLHAHAALAFRRGVFVQRRLDVLTLVRPDALHSRKVPFIQLTFTDLLMQRHQRRALFGEQQNPRGFAVEAVHQLQKLRLRARLAQLLDHPKRHPGSAVNGHPGGLIDHQQVRIFVKNREFCRRNCARGFGLLGDPKWRNADQITELQAVFRVNTAFVNAHLAGTQDAVNMAFGHALGHAHQEIIDALPFCVLADFNIGDRLAVECIAECATSGLLNAAIKWMA
jgi:hypothetical protein